MSPTLASLIAATDGIHARDPTTLDRLDASTASKRTPSSVVAALAFETSFFETHVAYAVERRRGDDDGEGGNVYADDDAEVVHVFTLKDKVREKLTRALTPLALRKFRRGREDEARSLGGAVPGPGSDVSVVRSNRGGYQSYADLLDSDSEDEVSDAVAEADAKDDDVLNRPPSWTVVNAIALEAYARVKRDSQRDDVTARDVYGWLNVNAPGDYNKLHAHDSVDRWSGVLYLATPSAMTNETIDDDDERDDERDAGALGIRGNTTARPHHTGGTDSTPQREAAERAPADASTTPYFVHAPTPGDLVVFTGAALHAVAPFHATTTKTTSSNAEPSDAYDDGPSDDVLRVSVAFNVDC